MVHEAITNGKISVLTEAVDLANKEFLANCDKNSKILVDRHSFNRDALITWCESISKVPRV